MQLGFLLLVISFSALAGPGTEFEVAVKGGTKELCQQLRKRTLKQAKYVLKKAKRRTRSDGEIRLSATDCEIVITRSKGFSRGRYKTHTRYVSSISGSLVSGRYECVGRLQVFYDRVERDSTVVKAYGSTRAEAEESFGKTCGSYLKQARTNALNTGRGWDHGWCTRKADLRCVEV